MAIPVSSVAPDGRQWRLIAGFVAIAVLGALAVFLGVAAHAKTEANAVPKPAAPLTPIEVRFNRIAQEIDGPLNAAPREPGQVAPSDAVLGATLARVQTQIIAGWPAAASKGLAVWATYLGKLRQVAAQGQLWSPSLNGASTAASQKLLIATFRAQYAVWQAISRS